MPASSNSKVQQTPPSHHITVHIPPLLWVIFTTILLLLLTIVFLLLLKFSPNKKLIPDVKNQLRPTQKVLKPIPSPSASIQTSNLEIVEGVGLTGVEIIAPVPNDYIISPVTIAGRANVFEGHVNLRVKDADGNELGEGFGTGCMGENPCPFEAEISFTNPTTGTGFVESYEVSMRDGSENNLLQIPVRFRN